MSGDIEFEFLGGFVKNLIFSDIVPPNIVPSNIVPPNIVTLIKIFRPQKRAITNGNFETRFSQPIGIINIYEENNEYK